MTAREDLAEVIRDGVGTWQTPLEAADAILKALAPRTITTLAELDALRFKSAILDANGCPWVNDGDAAEQWCSLAERGDPIWHNSDDIALPATVLHSPEVAK